VLNEIGNPEKIKDVKYLQTIDGLKKVKTKSKIGYGDVFDIGIDAPHLYVTPNGMIHHNTTIAKVLVNELQADSLFVNASLHSNIDLLRDKVSNFARTTSIAGGKKIVILDEVDGVTSNSFFSALRPMIEQYSRNCVFFMTCNYPEKVPQAIHSRMQNLDFSIKNKPEFAKKLMNRLTYILDTEKLEYDKKVLADVIKKFFPDIRKMLNFLQHNSDFLTDDSLKYKITGINIKPLLDAIKKNNFTEVRIILENDFVSSDTVYRQIYDALKEFFKVESIPTAILILSDYQHKHNFVIDKGINLMAMCVDIGLQCNFK